MRKAVLLRKIIINFCTPSQLRKFDDLSNVNKGSACHYGLRLVESYFDRKYPRENAVEPRENKGKKGRAFTINGYGRSWVQER